MSAPENPPAFPHESYDADADMDTVKTGMFLRDWFAGQALNVIGGMYAEGQSEFRDHFDVANMAYTLADAMLAERAKREGASDA